MNLVFENIEQNLTYQSIEPDLLFSKTEKNLVFQELAPKLKLKNEAKKLVFDVSQPVQLGFPYTFPFILS